jgi:hypothetical protein
MIRKFALASALAWRCSARALVQHLSNGGVAQPNPGIEFGILRYQYRFD